jgi:hypothetical protein
MSGTSNGLIGQIRKCSPHTYFAGCVCHLINLAVKDGCKAIATNVEEPLIDIFYHLKHSAKRQTELKEISQSDLKVLKYVPTRWLSLKPCLKRLLQLWKPLREFFKKECASLSGSGKRPQRAYEFLKSHTAKWHCMFLVYALEIFDAPSTELQAEKPLIPFSLSIQQRLYKNVLIRFLKPTAFVAKDLTEVNMDLAYERKSDECLSVGEEARNFMVKNKFDSKKTKAVCSSARMFYSTAAKKLLKVLPLKDPVLIHAEVFDLTKVKTKSFASVKYFVDNYPVAKPECPIDLLESEFLELQVHDIACDVLEMNRVDEQ